MIFPERFVPRGLPVGTRSSAVDMHECFVKSQSTFEKKMSSTGGTWALDL
jgi:hypothetical protein